MLLLIWSLEIWIPFFKGRKGRIKHAGRNLSIAFINTLVLGSLFLKPTAMVLGWGESLSLGITRSLDMNIWFSTILAIVLMDGWMYLWHIGNHRIPFLWRFHRMHHSDSEMDVTTALRFHTGEMVFSSLLRFAVVPLIGMSLWQLILYEIILLPIIQLHHSNVNIPERWDRYLRAIIVMPNMHRVHHSRWRLETDSDYASVFSFWDRIFGSFRLREDFHTLHYGLNAYDADEWQTTRGMLKTPFVEPFRYKKS